MHQNRKGIVQCFIKAKLIYLYTSMYSVKLSYIFVLLLTISASFIIYLFSLRGDLTGHHVQPYQVFLSQFNLNSSTIIIFKILTIYCHHFIIISKLRFLHNLTRYIHCIITFKHLLYPIPYNYYTQKRLLGKAIQVTASQTNGLKQRVDTRPTQGVTNGTFIIKLKNFV